MRRIVFLLLILTVLPTVSIAQKRLKATSFKEASQREQLDARRGELAKKIFYDGDSIICPLIKVQFREPNAVFEGPVPKNIKPEFKVNEYWVYMMPKAQHLVIKHPNYKKLDVEFGEFLEDNKSVSGVWKIESKHTYVLELEVEEDGPKSSFTVGAGFNVMPFMGPTVNVGFKLKKFSVEGGAVLGLSKSSEVYIYDKSSKLVDGYNYSALRAFLRVGYDILNVSSDVFSITPQAGAAFNTINGSQLSEISGSSDKVLDGASAISGTVGVRFMYAPSGVKGPLRIFVTPEYDFALSKDKNFEALSAFDSKIKSWAEGFNVNLGLMFYF